MAFDKVVDSEKLNSALTATANAIREKTGGTEPIVFDETQGFKASVESIDIGSSHKEGYIEIPYATRAGGLFQGAEFPEIENITVYIPNFKPDENNRTGVASMLTSAKVTDKITLISDCSTDLEISYSNAFGSCTMKIIDLTKFPRKIYAASNAFRHCTLLEEIIGVLDGDGGSENFINTFYGCKALREVRFKPNTIRYKFDISHSPDLSDASVQSIIDGLADLTGQDTLTLDFHSDIVLKLTEEQVMQIISKNWEVK